MGNRTSNSTSHSPQYGKIVLVLHSHLPYYRHHGMWPFGEENLYECMAETYIPLLDALLELQAEGIRANITIGVTPILCEQLADPHVAALRELKSAELRARAAKLLDR